MGEGELMNQIDPEKIERAKDILRQGWGWNAAARAIGVGYERLRCQLDEDYRARRQLYETTLRPPRKQRLRKVAVNKYVVRTIPENVIQERDLAYSARISTTAFICGDPPPGRSALDKKMAQSVWQK